MRIFARPDRGNAESARSRLTDIITVDRTTAVASTATAAAEIATLRQKLAAADADKTKSTRTPALLPSITARPDGVPSTAAAATEIATLRQKLTAAAANKTKNTPTLDGLPKRTAALLPGPPTLDATATAQVTHGQASESARAPESPQLVAVFIARELGFVGMV